MGGGLGATSLYLLRKRKGNGDATTNKILFNGFYIKQSIKNYNNY